MRRYRRGDYTLMHDAEAAANFARLEAVVFLNCDHWDSDWGGRVIYMAEKDVRA
jgi:Rps23 Pro-64 3,4-dihydroxylase Tpa1-like proline 4-hydroxylase